jgi:hypothetical protein
LCRKHHRRIGRLAILVLLIGVVGLNKLSFLLIHWRLVFILNSLNLDVGCDYFIK